jgi:hypothetical protein
MLAEEFWVADFGSAARGVLGCIHRYNPPTSAINTTVAMSISSNLMKHPARHRAS